MPIDLAVDISAAALFDARIVLAEVIGTIAIAGTATPGTAETTGWKWVDIKVYKEPIS